MSSSFDALNEKQLKAVTHPPANLLLLAGAGSGKTRVLTHRICWFLEQGFSPFQILAVTFTNKAAHEMRTRIDMLSTTSTHGMWIGTFHGLCHLLLRKHYEVAGLNQDFQIIDSADQQRVIKQIIKELNLDSTRFPPKKVQWFINKQKQKGIRSHDLMGENDYLIKQFLPIYQTYEETCRTNYLVDFGELLVRTLELLTQDSDLLTHYQARFAHVLVDEFQDTNTLQYNFVSLLGRQGESVTVVGDDDQSIYSWRGASWNNMQQFRKDFAPVETIKLEQNYRSTQHILKAANAVIAQNKSRLEKELWSAGEEGELITTYLGYNAQDEAAFITGEIKRLVKTGQYSYLDMAILYRSNVQSRLLEEQFILDQIPYRIYGGLKFFDRAEIKDALAYCRILVNPQDNASFERIINLPTRGIGNTTLSAIRTWAREHETSLFDSATLMVTQSILSNRATNALQHFITLIKELKIAIQSIDLLGDQIKIIVEGSGLIAHYSKDTSPSGRSRIENLQELQSAANQFSASIETTDHFHPYKIEDHPTPTTKLSQFLSYVALESGEMFSNSEQQVANLMTLHAVKGLEFKVVFITGLEENLLPHQMSLKENGLEEERRLLYVGMTRAMERLYLTHAKSRDLYGQTQSNPPSCFFNELPEKLLRPILSKFRISRPLHFQRAKVSSFSSSSTTLNRSFNSKESIASQTHPFKVGDQVKHKKFGMGVITAYEGEGERTRVQVTFHQLGSKWLILSYAHLEKIG